ncbi:MAG: hypothetical protein Q4P17_07625 [Methanobacterium sp.]|nr:hypothetical protein [Methanobacterium sp.]
MADNKQYTLHEIEQKTGLRQPPVSVAMSWMKKNIPHHLSIELPMEPTGLKGRTAYLIRLKSPLDQVIAELAQKSVKNNTERLEYAIKIYLEE